MEGSKKFFLRLRAVCIVCTLLLLFASFFSYNGTTANALADTSDESKNSIQQDEREGNSPTPRLFESLSLSINGGDGAMWATVKNDFTLFSSTIIVIVELYYSETYYENYSDMVMASIEATENLTMGQTITAKASTNGRKLYWQGRMRYKVNNGSWQSEVTGTILCDSNGGYLGIL